jgi:small subunit ribosomal protein S17
MAHTQDKAASRRNPLVGTVVSRSGRKTCGVVIERLVKHARYGKYLRRRTRLAVHDPDNQAGVGDRVAILPCRPISKHKSWRLVRVVRRSAAPSPPPGAQE